METLSRQVIELYKETVTRIINGESIDRNAVFGTKKAISEALTTARILCTPTDELERLRADLDYFNRF